MASTITLKRRIGSIRNTRQITKAMELVAASKMRRAQERMVASRPYADKLREVLAHVFAGTGRLLLAAPHAPARNLRITRAQIGLVRL